MMYLITYEIKHPHGRTMKEIRSTIEAVEDSIIEFGAWWHYFMSVWIVDTDMTVDEMTRALREHLGDKDDLLIIGIQAPYEGALPEHAWTWLMEKERNHGLPSAERDREVAAAS